MSAGKLAVLIAFLVLWAAYQSVKGAEPPPDQVHDAAAAAALLPDSPYNCKWVDEHTCVSVARFEELTGRPVGDEEPRR